MTMLYGVLRGLLAGLAASGLAACSPSTGIGFNGGVPPIETAPLGANGCNPAKGAIGGISVAGKPPRASSGNLAATSETKPGRADSKPERAGTMPARQQSGVSPQSGVAGSHLSAPSGC